MDLSVGDVITMKKGHPCGANEWEILRVGADFRLKCLGCGHQIMVPRKTVEKSVRKVISPGSEGDGMHKEKSKGDDSNA